MNTVGVILAAGSGSRTGFSTPKQFLPLGGKTVLEHSVQTFHNHPGIDQVVIVTAPQFIAWVENLISAHNWTKVSAVLPGGKERFDSSLAAVRYFAGNPDAVMLFHDAARPLVSEQIITDTLKAMEKYDAVDVAIPTVDTIVQCDAAGTVMESIQERHLLWRMQTPQGFRQKTIQEAYCIALQDPAFTATDDCGTVLRYLPDVKIGIVRGSERNIKLTYADDLSLLEFLLSKQGE
ncbi:MAG: 2-C-methyl-D-erythritol 4-phosphate cytidylyltransferase [Bacteroidaceae bacterium]|nr:2-C-methyl-D-erythritol 4-phosphate cytidylyltransferase [Bacteroidaceae bacterium]